MTDEEAIKTLKDNICAQCAYCSDMENCDIRYCDNREAIKVLKRKPSTDAVNREDVKTFVESFIHEIITESGTDKNAHTNEVLREVSRGIGDIPPVNPERSKGEWIKYSIPRCGEQHYKCSHCDEYVNFGLYGDFYTKDFIYCPHCGADMREVES